MIGTKPCGGRLLLRVLDALYPRVLPEQQTADQKKLVETLDHLQDSIYRQVEWQELGKWTVDWLRLIQQAKDAGVELTEAFLPVPGVVKNLLKLAVGHKDEDSSGLSGGIGREIHSYYREQLVSMEQFEQAFRDALQLALGENGRLIVFVDDLDRCLPEQAIEVLEAIKLFLEVEGTVFVLGMDKEVVELGIQARYGAMFHTGGIARAELPISGDAYLQKIVQIPFHLPPLVSDDRNASSPIWISNCRWQNGWARPRARSSLRACYPILAR